MQRIMIALGVGVAAASVGFGLALSSTPEAEQPIPPQSTPSTTGSVPSISSQKPETGVVSAQTPATASPPHSAVPLGTAGAPAPTASVQPPRVLKRRLHAKSQVELVFVAGGEFRMGSPPTEHRRGDGESLHTVTVSDFWLGKTEVTRKQYARYLQANKDAATPPEFWQDPRFKRPGQPVVGVSWGQAQAYAAWAGLRLPTEAEWEYAARAGSNTAYSTGNEQADLDAIGWFERNSSHVVLDVAEKPASAFGLHDMHGSVWEWCSDWYGPYLPGPLNNPTGPATGDRRSVRGGSWDDPAYAARSAHRAGFEPTRRFRQVGFRVALTP